MVLQWSVEFGTLLCDTLSVLLAGCWCFLFQLLWTEKGPMATSQDQSEFLVQQKFYPKTKGVQDDFTKKRL